MKILLSPTTVDEADVVINCESKCDILDIKNVQEGSLGAQMPWIIKDIVQRAHDKGFVTSATLGDLPDKPGTAAQAALGVAHCGVDYIKAGLYESRTVANAAAVMRAVVQAVKMVNANAKVVASGYGDFARFGGLHWRDLVEAAHLSGCDAVLIDTYIKDGRSLFDNMNFKECAEFCNIAKGYKMEVALAGSVNQDNLADIFKIQPSFIGVRGAVCESGNRANKMTHKKITEFLSLVSGMQEARAA